MYAQWTNTAQLLARNFLQHDLRCRFTFFNHVPDDIHDLVISEASSICSNARAAKVRVQLEQVDDVDEVDNAAIFAIWAGCPKNPYIFRP
eukprot:12194197-Karenia_brevis.AAC.1